MSTVKSTFGALLGTVASTATVVTSTLNAASTGADMLNKYAEHHALQQRKDYAVLALASDDIAAEKAAKAKIERVREIRTMNMNAEELALFQQTMQEVKTAIAAA